MDPIEQLTDNRRNATMTNSDEQPKPKRPQPKRGTPKPVDPDAEVVKRVTPKQDRMIIAIMNSSTLTAAAESAGVDRATMHKWLKEDHFKQALQEERRRILDQSLNRFVGLNADAMIALQRNLGNPDVIGVPPVDRTGSEFPQPYTQVQAASKIIEFTHRLMESMMLHNEVELMRYKIKELQDEIARRAASQNDVLTDAGDSSLVGFEGEGYSLDALPSGDQEESGENPSARGEDAGPVANGLSQSPNETIEPFVLPPSGEDDGSGGESSRSLFDE